MFKGEVEQVECQKLADGSYQYQVPYELGPLFPQIFSDIDDR